MTNRHTLSVSFLPILLFLTLPLIFSPNVEFVRFAQGAKRIEITDDLDDVVDDEEDEAWKQWGKKSTPPPDFDLPASDLSKMELPEIQAEMMKRQTGPAFGFVKLRLGVKRTRDMVAETAMKWTKILKTGSIEATFMGVDLSTIMFTMGRGQDVSELKEFVFSQPEAYEIKIGDQIFRRPGDPPLEEVLEKQHTGKNKEENSSPEQTEKNVLKEEL